MSTSPRMSNKREETFDKKKVKKKMSKAQIQLAIVKKKQCDAKALTIVEQLLEPNVDPQWLLSNLGYINKSHMEDVIEERAIIKLCGYILCDNALTVVIKQQYHISTKKNKVYDVSRRKNFCSSKCYGACNYLLEQMLTSPLWLREKEEIPVFRFLPAKEELERSIPGEEIHVCGSDPVANADNENSENLKKDENAEEEVCEGEAEMKNKPSARPISEQNLAAKQDLKEGDNGLDNDLKKPLSDGEKDDNSSLTENVVDPKANKSKKRVTFGGTLERTFSTADTVQLEYTEVQDVKELSKCDSLIEEDILDEDDLDYSKTDDNGACDNKEIDTSISSNTTLKRKKEKNKRNKSKKDLQEDSNKSDTCEFYTLAMRIEKNVREWFTEDTICLLSGEENTKTRLLENVSQHDRYLQLCKKLNKLQLEDDKDDKTNLVKGSLKPLPHLSVLQEEGKKMELKVRAFFKGKTVIESPEVVPNNDAVVNDESAPVLPLTDAHAPKALRRRIFLDKLHKILPDLLRALASNRPQLLAQYAYGTEKSALIKALVNTFALSAKNIIFKTTEWTLVGLIFIKMLSILDPQMKTLLTTKQARIYISMILMSYKLDPNYLDRLVIELTNNPKIFTANSDENTLNANNSSVCM